MAAGPFLCLSLLKLSTLLSTFAAVQFLVDCTCKCVYQFVCTFTQHRTLLCTVCSSTSALGVILHWHSPGSLLFLLWPLCILNCLLCITENNTCLHPQESLEPEVSASLEPEVSEPKVKVESRQALIKELKIYKASLQLSLTAQCYRLAELRKELNAPEPDWIKRE
jgi:hypothetical protein